MNLDDLSQLPLTNLGPDDWKSVIRSIDLTMRRDEEDSMTLILCVRTHVTMPNSVSDSTQYVFEKLLHAAAKKAMDDGDLDDMSSGFVMSLDPHTKTAFVQEGTRALNLFAVKWEPKSPTNLTDERSANAEAPARTRDRGLGSEDGQPGELLPQIEPYLCPSQEGVDDESDPT